MSSSGLPGTTETRTCWSKSTKRVTKIFNGQEHLTQEKRLRNMKLFSLEKRRLTLIFIPFWYKYLKGGSKEDGARLFSVFPSERTRHHGGRLKHRKFCLSKKILFFYCEGDQTLWLNLILQRDCAVSITGDTQDPTGHSPRQPALADCCEHRAGQDNL